MQNSVLVRKRDGARQFASQRRCFARFVAIVVDPRRERPVFPRTSCYKTAHRQLRPPRRWGECLRDRDSLLLPLRHGNGDRA